ncbi:MAG TPA: hypothetical protein VNU73_04130 [Steroidobacteraceae bacterium]|nr:hypothetical protein [Steroidobacteraceae bacterium]
MFFRRGFVTAALLIMIALCCLAVTRRLERERRLIALLRRRDAVVPERAVRIAELSDDDQDTARDLLGVGLLRRTGESCYLESASLPPFRRRRVRLALAGAAAALGLAVLAALALLRR